MLPDVLSTQLRDEAAGIPVGQRVLRIATHAAVRSRGLGSELLSEIKTEFADQVDWLGVSYGATPELVRFWADNGYSTVHLATSRNATSGEYSVVMLDPVPTTGRRSRPDTVDGFRTASRRCCQTRSTTATPTWFGQCYERLTANRPSPSLSGNGG